jgi:nitrogen regulatory protein PII
MASHILIMWHFLCFYFHGEYRRINKAHWSRQSGVGSLRFFISTESNPMKKIEATFKPFKLDAVRTALASLGINNITFSEVQGCGQRNGPSETYRANASVRDFSPKIKMEVVVNDSLSGAVSAAIIEAARTGSIGDGQILISTVDEAVAIRAQETQELAVC